MLHAGLSLLLQVVIIVVYGVRVLQVSMNAEKKTDQLVQGLVDVPFTAPDIAFDLKLRDFFMALDTVFEELQVKEGPTSSAICTYLYVFRFYLFAPMSCVLFIVNVV